jgi:hypothetical protein
VEGLHRDGACVRACVRVLVLNVCAGRSSGAVQPHLLPSLTSPLFLTHTHTHTHARTQARYLLNVVVGILFANARAEMTQRVRREMFGLLLSQDMEFYDGEPIIGEALEQVEQTHRTLRPV